MAYSIRDDKYHTLSLGFCVKNKYSYVKIRKMFKKFTIADKILFVAALLSLIFAEILYFQGAKEDGIFIGIWVPSILAFGIYLKLINNTKNG